jgi:hypothetical protein
MLTALEAYLGAGGRFMYLGGNGFYWRVSFDPAHPGLIELRRAEDGTRAWAEQPGQYYHATGEYGGLWRRIGRPPNALVGIGFIAQGFDASTYYRRTLASRDPRAAFLFSGIEEDVIGDFGAWGGGAAGLEIDCRCQSGLAAARARRGLLRRPQQCVPAGERGDALELARRRWHAQFAHQGGYRILRNAGRRRRALDGIDRLCREPRPGQLRQQHLSADPKRPRSLPGSGALQALARWHCCCALRGLSAGAVCAAAHSHAAEDRLERRGR